MSESLLVNSRPEENFPVSVEHIEGTICRQLSALTLDLSVIPAGWFLDGLFDNRTPCRVDGDRHVHLRWTAKLQHETGGKLVIGNGGTPQGAIESALFEIQESLEFHRWGRF